MLIQGKLTTYNTQKELRLIEDAIITAALNNGTYWDIIEDLRKQKVPLQYDDTEQNTRNLVKRITSKTWVEIKKEIQQKAEDYSGIVPIRSGYKYKTQTFEKLEEAHQRKLQCEYPKLARIMYN